MGLMRRVAILFAAALVVPAWVGTTASPAAASGSWSALGTGTNDTVYSTATGPDGTLYAGGNFTSAGGVSANRIAKWDGTTWRALGAGMNLSNVEALAVAPDGTLYAGGSFTTAGGVSANRIAKWNGTTWSALATGLNDSVTALAVAPDGTLYAAGYFTTAGGVSANRIAKWNGSAWSALGTGMNNDVYALAVAANGTLYAGGRFSSANGVSANRIASWNGTTWAPLCETSKCGSGSAGLSGDVHALATSGATVYAGGNFLNADGSTVNRIATWNGTSWSALGSGMPSSVRTLAVAPDGTLYAGGSFETAGGVSASRVASWNGTSWNALGAGANNQVISISLTGSRLYAGGTFTSAGGVSASRVAVWTTGSPALTPTFDTPVRTAGGFTVNVTNYDASYTWAPTAASGSVSAGTPSGTTLPLTVTGLSAGASAVVTVTTSRTGYLDASATVTGQAKSTQTVTWSPTTAVTTVQSPLTPSTSATALGSAPISYAVVSGFTTTTCSVDATSGQVTYTGTGSCTVRATAAETSTYLQGTRDVTFTVSKATQVVSWSPATAVTTVQSPVTPAAATTSGDGVITYAKVSSTTTTCTVDPGTGQLTYTGTGNCVVRATAAGTDLYDAGSADATFTVSKATPALTWAPSTAFTVPDASTTFTAATTDSDGVVSYSLTTNTAGCSLSGRVLSFTQEGSCGVTASVASTDTYNAASTVSTFAISKATQTMTWSPAATLTLASLSTTLPAATTSGDGAITYAVFSAGGSGCAFTNPSSPVLTYSAAGTCSVTATAAATTGYAQGTQSATITIALATPTMTWAPTTALSMPAATVTPTAASTTGDGAITYAVTSGSNCSVDTTTGALTYAATGPCQVTATSATTSRYAAGSTAVTFTVSLATQTITGAASSSSLRPGGTATLTHTGSTGTGAITWTSASTGVCTITGTTVTAIADGACILTVAIAADTTYAAASSTVTLTITTPSAGGGSSGGGGSAATGGDSTTGGNSPAGATTGAGTASTSEGASAQTPISAMPGGGVSTRRRSLPPPPLMVKVTPVAKKTRAKVLVGLPPGSAGASVLGTVVVVRDMDGRVVSRITLELEPGQKLATVTVPYVADGYSVNVYNVNEVGVSTGALRTSPLVHATTIAARSSSGAPTLFGAPLGRPIVFSGGSASLDAQDRRQLRALARAAKTSSSRLFITGFARKGGTGSSQELASLSTARAKAVGTYLAAQGVRVWTRYWGAGTLNGTGSTSDRRVEIRTSAQPIPRSLVP